MNGVAEFAGRALGALMTNFLFGLLPNPVLYCFAAIGLILLFWKLKRGPRRPRGQ